MIKSILYVEDGSVDVDTLQDELGNETKVIVYRQGSTPPVLVQPQTPINTIFDDSYERQCKELQKVKEILSDVFCKDRVSKKVFKKLSDLYADLFE